MQKLTGKYVYMEEDQNTRTCCLELWYSHQYCILSVEDKYYLFDYDQVMMIADTIASRTFCYLFSQLTSDLLPGRIQQKDLTEVYEIFDDLFTDHGNGSYLHIRY